MWKSLILLAVLAISQLIVSATEGVSSADKSKGKVKDTHTIITTITNATSNADTNATSENGTIGAEAGASASVTTIVKTHTHTVDKCGRHEKYVKCQMKRHHPQLCQDMTFPLCDADGNCHDWKGITISYDDEDNKKCHGPPACLCIEDYARDMHGVCIHVTKCPQNKVSCGKNATIGCGVNCSRRCSNYMNKNISCSDNDICYTNSCDCIKDYVLDDNTGECVLPEDCNKNAPEPEGGQGITGNGAPNQEGENACDSCNAECKQTEKMEGSSKQNQCASEGSKGQQTGDGSKGGKNYKGDKDEEKEEGNENEGTSGSNTSSEETEWSTTMKSESTKPMDQSTTDLENMRGSTTKKLEVTTASPGEDMCREDPDTEMTSKDPDTEKSEATTATKGTTKASSSTEFQITLKASETKSTTEYQSTTPRRRRTRRPRTTTMHPAIGMQTTAKPKISTKSNTDKSGMETTTRMTRRSKKPTTASGGEEETTINNSGSESKTESGTTAADECNKRHERYYECASSCPEYTCRDYNNRNTTRCNRRQSSSNCKAGCRCRNNYYKNKEGECVTGKQCRRQARSTTTAMTTVKGRSSQMSSSTEMMPTTQDPESCEEDALQIYIEANLKFTAKILADLSLKNIGTNLLCGGSSILFLLAQLALYASGDSRNRILGVLGLKTEQIKCLFPKLYANLTVDFPDIELDMMCNIVADESCTITDDFKNLIHDEFQILPLNLDLQAVESATSLSDTVASLTNNGILNFVTSDILSRLTSLVLVDAQLFTGELEKKFDVKNTLELDFHLSDGSVVKTPMMHQTGRFLYTDNKSLGCKVMKMKYKGGDFTLAIFLPHAIDGIEELVKKLVDVELVTLVLDSLRYVTLDIYVPRINVTTTSTLKQPTITANVDAIFNGDTAGLQGVASCEKPFVSEILQTVSLLFDEVGDGISVNLDSSLTSKAPTNPRQRGQVFKADRPFVYYLFYHKIVIMAGVKFQ